MKVLLVNGSPHQHGCTYTALAEIAHTLQEEGVDSEIFWIGNKPIGGCIGCHGCIKLGKCAFNDDPVNAFTAKAKEADGFIFGSPVHYAAATGNMTAFMDRVYPKPFVPLRTKPTRPGHTPSNTAQRPPGRHHRHPGPTEPVLYHCPNAGDLLSVLEYGSRLYPGGCNEGPGGSAGDASTGAEYGLLLEVQSRRCRRRRGAAQNGASHSYQLY